MYSHTEQNSKSRRYGSAASPTSPNVMYTSCESNWKEQIAHVFLWTLCSFYDSNTCVRMVCRANNSVHTTPSNPGLGEGARLGAKGKIDSTNSFTFIYLNSKRKQSEIEEIVLLLLWNNCKYWIGRSHTNIYKPRNSHRPTHTHTQTTDKRHGSHKHAGVRTRHCLMWRTPTAWRELSSWWDEQHEARISQEKKIRKHKNDGGAFAFFFFG